MNNYNTMNTVNKMNSVNEYRYKLEPYGGMNTRYDCPKCEKRKVFTRYIDLETGEHVSSTSGLCSRLINCAYHYAPKQFFADNNLPFDKGSLPIMSMAKKRELLKPSYIPLDIFKQSRTGYEKNNLVQFLLRRFDSELVTKVISDYHIATSKYQFRNREFPDYVSETGATVFWQIDTQGEVRTGKIMLYSPNTGKRIKEPFNHIGWVHKALKQPEFQLAQCFFGEHLLIDKSKAVGIVESEKTAIISSIYFPDLIWLAVGSLQNLSKERCKVLKGRNVILFPDLKAFDKWNEKAKEFSSIGKFTTSEILEVNATNEEREKGLDLADYLLKMDYREFINTEKNNSCTGTSDICGTSGTTTETLQPIAEPIRARKIKPAGSAFEPWDLSEVENYFEANPPIEKELALNQYETIVNMKKFISSSLSTIRTNNGNPVFKPYFDRLLRAKELLTNAPASAS